jgi:hypothetical protein
MLDYEKVLETVKKILPKIQGGQVKQSMHGGLSDDRENNKVSINSKDALKNEGMPLLEGDVFIAHIAGTIEIDERERLKKLLFRATRGKALTIFEDYEPLLQEGELRTKKPKQKTVYTIVF